MKVPKVSTPGSTKEKKSCLNHKEKAFKLHKNNSDIKKSPKIKVAHKIKKQKNVKRLKKKDKDKVKIKHHKSKDKKVKTKEGKKSTKEGKTSKQKEKSLIHQKSKKTLANDSVKADGAVNRKRKLSSTNKNSVPANKKMKLSKKESFNSLIAGSILSNTLEHSSIVPSSFSESISVSYFPPRTAEDVLNECVFALKDEILEETPKKKKKRKKLEEDSKSKKGRPASSGNKVTEKKRKKPKKENEKLKTAAKAIKCQEKPKMVVAKIENGSPTSNLKAIEPASPARRSPNEQRMASLDALAKMHVLCTPEKRSASVEKSPKTDSEKGKLEMESRNERTILSDCISTVTNVKKEKSASKKLVFEKTETISKSNCLTLKLTDGKDQLALQPAASKGKIKKPLKTKQPPKSKAKDSSKKDKNICKKCGNLKEPGHKCQAVTKKRGPVPKKKKEMTEAVKKKEKQTKVRETFKMKQTCTFKSVTVNSKTTKDSLSSNKKAVTQFTRVKAATTTNSLDSALHIVNEEIHNDHEDDRELTSSRKGQITTTTTTTTTTTNKKYHLEVQEPCPAEKLTSPPSNSHLMDTVIQEGQDCCSYLTHSPIIPVAHAQSCRMNHGLPRMNVSLVSVGAQSSHFDNAFTVTRYGPQQTLLYSSNDCVCYHCTRPMMQPLHDSCLIHESVPYHHHHHPSSTSVSQRPYPDSLCPSCHHIPSTSALSLSPSHGPYQTQISCIPQSDHSYTQDNLHSGFSGVPHPIHQLSKSSKHSTCLPSTCPQLAAWSQAPPCHCFDPVGSSQLDAQQHNCLCPSSPTQPVTSTDFMSAEYHTIVPCDQTPLDLSQASSAATTITEIPPDTQTLYQSSLCCGRNELVVISPPPPSSHQTTNAVARRPKTRGPKVCCTCGESNQQMFVISGARTTHQQHCVQKKLKKDTKDSSICNDSEGLEQNGSDGDDLANSTHKTVHIIRLRHHVTKSGQQSLRHASNKLKKCGIVAVSDIKETSHGILHQLHRQVEDNQSVLIKGVDITKINGTNLSNVPYKVNFSAQNCEAKQEKLSHKLPSIPKCIFSRKTGKRKFAHGWAWEGKAYPKPIILTNDTPPCMKHCFPAMRHLEGDIIRERDCVLLRSGPRSTDLPFVAKVAALWENPEDGEMMMSLLWYYRPEHTEQGRRDGQMEDEVFASKHRDVNSVACIEDKCYVVTFSEYCRYRARLRMMEDRVVNRQSTVPKLGGSYFREERLPPGYISPDMVFFCRSVYDFRQKRILKNPT